MTGKKKRYSADFKAKVALEAFRGESKTMMAAFIIAIRGTLTQAVLLGLAATASHTAVVWLIALGGLYFGQQWGGEASEPYFQLASAVAIIAIAA